MLTDDTPYPNPCCPFCGDKSSYRLWADPEPPTECPYDPSWKGPSACKRQWDGYHQRVRLQEKCPEAFDSNGVLKDWAAAMKHLGPDEEILLTPWRPRLN